MIYDLCNKALLGFREQSMTLICWSVTEALIEELCWPLRDPRTEGQTTQGTNDSSPQGCRAKDSDPLCDLIRNSRGDESQTMVQ